MRSFSSFVLAPTATARKVTCYKVSLRGLRTDENPWPHTWKASARDLHGKTRAHAGHAIPLMACCGSYHFLSDASMLAMLGAELTSGSSVSLPAPLRAVFATIHAMDIAEGEDGSLQITSVLGEGAEPLQLNRLAKDNCVAAQRHDLTVSL